MASIIEKVLIALRRSPWSCRPTAGYVHGRFASNCGWRRAFWSGVLVCVCTMKIMGIALAAAQGDPSVKIVYEKDLVTEAGYGAFAWRPDSKAIAYAHGGRIS